MTITTANDTLVYKGPSGESREATGVFNLGMVAGAVARVTSSAASGNPAFVKASPGGLLQFWGQNAVASVRYIHFYNKATAPTLGTDTPLFSYQIPASAAFNVTMPAGGVTFSTGIAFAITTDNVTVPITGAAAADITSLAIFAA